MISVFDIFKIGIGPSSSHTVGPMKAGKQFTDDLIAQNLLHKTTKVVVDVYGSLSLTGKGHHTDIAIIMGLAGNLPDTVDIDAIPGFIQDVNTHSRLMLANGAHEVAFPVDQCMNFHADNLALHENGMRITALAGDDVVYSQTYYSIGGGFIVDEAHFGQTQASAAEVPYPYKTAADLQRHCRETGLSLSGLMMKNELALRSKEELEAHFSQVWDVMRAGIERGITTEGVLPGKLRVPRRAAALRRMLVSHDKNDADPMNVVDWINMFALAVNEENAAGGRVVTAPTNGACGIVPAVLAYYDKFIREVNANSLARYLLVASAVGSLYKMNASISGAEVGCQGEVGVACSMAAAGLTELLGGSPAQVCIAAEIAMEHNLGLTCDPVAGQVQVPCIERNAIASVKAVNAARMALRRTSEPRVCLDKVIETMFETGKDMNARYRETSRGGLAVKVVACD
ncbi:L-serine ammonia-lyase [Cronobacter universalis]|uniref:L-serine dehydratase n=1 Tax=Cronobacter universalis NCTC 9529 TaxID=1074000 RepID=A0AAC8VS95_9ENTR|nr:L-serine ammonia-lyase [Cronobacter universalis]ALB56013.1 serine dehydratase [Cronobacter universalis NCTC 9529]ELY6244945.1 L-serine ammonia-lyase [Cronobacter universalis]ELY7390703.1 L-serine ammonia-lyase [Cronobacter universalis]CCK15821.1 L-serine dehydratase [Cronobacter universalis NCTC 9529]STD13979.1 L-serine dehydratase 2 [Cronobacter universalis NCTC 9529]